MIQAKYPFIAFELRKELHYKSICKICLDRNTSSTSSSRKAMSKGNENEKAEISAKVGEESESEGLENEEKAEICMKVGEELYSLIAKDVKNLYKSNAEIKKIETLVDYKANDWVLDRPAEILHLIGCICGIDLNVACEKKLNIVAKIIELIYYSHDSKLILPNHFLENLLSYCFTNCKTYTNFVVARGP